MILDALPPPLAAVTEVRLYRTEERDDATPEAGTFAAAQGGGWRLDATVLGRRWVTLVGTTTTGDPASVALAQYVDFPDDDTLVVSPEAVAVKAGITLPLTTEQRDIITDTIRDAQADVEAYLGRSVVPRQYVQEHAYAWPEGWRLTEHDGDVLRVLSATLEDGNYFTVTYLAGLDAKRDPALRPIVRFITAHALNSPEFTRMWQATSVGKAAREVRSVSAEGQSISFQTATLGGGGQAGSLVPGSLPTMESLDRWRLRGRRVYQGPTRATEWPFGSMVATENRDWFER